VLEQWALLTSLTVCPSLESLANVVGQLIQFFLPHVPLQLLPLTLTDSDSSSSNPLLLGNMEISVEVVPTFGEDILPQNRVAVSEVA
jgi:hypothetical protein